LQRIADDLGDVALLALRIDPIPGTQLAFQVNR
jgi:hypothetical protein